MAETKRRARGEDSIYYDRSRDRWTGTITFGWKADGHRDRITVRGRNKTEVKDKLRASAPSSPRAFVPRLTTPSTSACGTGSRP
jgi:hypothetical protein